MLGTPVEKLLPAHPSTHALGEAGRRREPRSSRAQAGTLVATAPETWPWPKQGPARTARGRPTWWIGKIRRHGGRVERDAVQLPGAHGRSTRSSRRQRPIAGEMETGVEGQLVLQPSGGEEARSG